jgi:transposase
LPRHGRRSVRGDRAFVNAVLFLMKTGCSWRDLPGRFGKWKTIYYEKTARNYLAIVHPACALHWLSTAA